MKRLGVLFLLLASGIPWAKGPSTAHFCVQHFSKSENSYEMVIRNVGEVVADRKWKWPDSLACGNAFWKNGFVLEYKGERIEFDGDYKDAPSGSVCKICTDEARLRNSAVPAPSMDKLSAYEYYTSHEISEKNKRPIEKSFIEELYGKKLKVEWKSSLSCSCPKYEVSTLKTKLNVVIDGECAPAAADSMDDDEGEWLGGCSCSGGEKCASDDDAKETKKDTVPAPGMFPCYSFYSTYEHPKVNYYGSSKVMNMDGHPEGRGTSLGCFNIQGKNYLVLGSNVPAQIHTAFDDENYNYCYDSVRNLKQKKRVETPFYSCYGGKSSPKGCLPREDGFDLVFDSKGKFTGREYTGKEMKDILLPANVSEKVLAEIGDDAARKTAGMAFYCGDERVGYKKFVRNQLHSLKEAFDECNARTDSSVCRAVQARNDSILVEEALRQKEWEEKHRKEVEKIEKEKKAFYDSVEATKKRLENDSAFIKLNQAYAIFKRYEKLKYWDLEGKEIANPDSVHPLEIAKRKWVVSIEDSAKYAKVMDSIKTLNSPFFERIHARSEAICKGRPAKKGVQKELNDLLLAWYRKEGGKDYFVENRSVSYTTEPCKADKNLSETFGMVVETGCKYTTIDTFCVDTKGANFKRLFLTGEDWDALDVFSGCDRWTGTMKHEEDRYNKTEFLPIEISWNEFDMCFDYGADGLGDIYLDLENGVATASWNCFEHHFKKIDGVWKYEDTSVTCWH